MVDHILSVPSVYANLGLAILALPNNLNQGGAGGDRWWIQMAAGSRGTGNIGTISGADATHFVEVSAIPGVAMSTCLTGAFRTATDYTYVHDLTVDTNLSFYAFYFSNFGGNTTKAERVLIKQAFSGQWGAFSDFGTKFINCISISNAGQPFGRKCYCYGCIAKGGNVNYAKDGSDYGKAYNCISIDSITTGFQTLVGDHNCSTDNTAPGVNSIKNALVTDMKFKDYNNNDFHIAATSILASAGGDQSSVYTADADGVLLFGDYPIGPYTFVPTCWSYRARYKNSSKLFSLGGHEKFPSKLKVPGNVDRSSGIMTDEGKFIDPGLYVVE